MKLKTELSRNGIKMDNFDPAISWENLKKKFGRSDPGHCTATIRPTMS